MSKINRKWILRSLQVLIALVLMLSVVPAGAHDGEEWGRGYYHSSDADWWYVNPDWMAKIPGHRRLSELSIPATHDTGAHKINFIFFEYCQCQTLRLSTQLEAGIRHIDIRLARDNGELKVYHNKCYQDHAFEDVLNDVVGFLEAHRDETVIMNVQENPHTNIGINNKSFIEMVEDYLQKTYHDPYDNPIGPYWDWIWTPTSANPTLDEVRGKIVIQDNLSQVGVDVDWGSENDVGQYSSLALDDNDQPHISYYDANNGYLKYAYLQVNSGWQFEEIEKESAGDVGQHTSLALDENDYPHISYYDVDNGNLKYAFWTGDSWWFAPIDTSDNDVGQYSSLALEYVEGGGVLPHISYYDATDGDLLYAFKDSSGWHYEQVDHGDKNNVGQYSSLALEHVEGGGVIPHFSYYDDNTNDLLYAFKDSSGWHYEQVDHGDKNNVGQYSSLALEYVEGGFDIPHISYYDANTKDLKYASGTKWSEEWGWDWQLQKVDHGSENDVGKHSSLALDANDNPHISYYDANTGSPRYAYLDNNSGWVHYFGISGERDEGLYTSLALDGNNRPHFSYYDATEGDLMYVGGLDRFCSPDTLSITQFGIRMCAGGQSIWSLNGGAEMYTIKWPAVKAALDEADKAPRDMFYANGLNATTAVEPWFAASGHTSYGTGEPQLWTGLTTLTCGGDCYPDFPRKDCVGQSCSIYYEGMNELTLTYLTDPDHQPIMRPRRWGTIWMDFPGWKLIDEIINSNFFKGAYLPNIVK